MFDIQEELKKLPAKPAVFSEQQKSYTEDSSDGQPCGSI